MTTKPADTAIEKAARVLQNFDESFGADEPLDPCFLVEARAAVIAYLTATMVPTREIEDAGTAAQVFLSEVDGYRHLNRAEAERAYRAMRSAELSSLKGKVGE